MPGRELASWWTAKAPEGFRKLPDNASYKTLHRDCISLQQNKRIFAFHHPTTAPTNLVKCPGIPQLSGR